MTTRSPAPISTSVLIPSLRRPDFLKLCLSSLAIQTRQPDQVVIVWQNDDTATRDAAEQAKNLLPFELRIIHQPEAGIVTAENAALAAASGSVILLIDDDAVAPADWVARHAAHYDDPGIGAVGGPAANHRQDGAPFPVRRQAPQGKLTRLGRFLGNMHDHPEEWKDRTPIDADHLVGYNMSLRRAAFDRFETRLKPYWQLFEVDACLQARKLGYRVVFDYGIVVKHTPTNTAYTVGRDGNLEIKIYNPAFNACLILSKHSPSWLRPWRLLYRLLIGSMGTPGLLAAALAVWRYGSPKRELDILWHTWRASLAGWAMGLGARR